MKLEEVFVKGRTKGLADIVRIGNEKARLLWGFQYTRGVGSNSNPEKKREVEIVYEGAKGLLYLSRGDSLQQIVQNLGVCPVYDFRFCLFSLGIDREQFRRAKELYKAFFYLITRKQLEGRITGEELVRILRTINGLYYKMYCDVGNTNSRRMKVQIIKEYSQLLSLDPDMSPHLEEVRKHSRCQNSKY